MSIKKVWGRVLSRAVMAFIALAVLAWAGLWWQANRDMPPPTLAERQQSYQRAVDWFRAHEAEVLADGNAALWLMIKTAAQHTQDPYLAQLLQRSMDAMYTGRNEALPWRRLIEPKAAFTHDLGLLGPLSAYQRFFYHAATCARVEIPGYAHGSDDFLERNVCRPMATRVWLEDRVCSTHQMMGLHMIRQTGCPLPGDPKPIEDELLGDIRTQLWLDPMFQDAYIQRVLVLQWLGGAEAVRPSWLWRVMNAQQANGGWVGSRHVPGLPDWLQPWGLRQLLADPVSVLSGKPIMVTQPDFHPTAQGLLLLALSLPPRAP